VSSLTDNAAASGAIRAIASAANFSSFAKLPIASTTHAHYRGADLVRSPSSAPPRLMVPRKGEIPFTWNRAITAVAREYMRARLKER